MALLSRLPPPKSAVEQQRVDDVASQSWYQSRLEVIRPQAVSKHKEPPPYGKRSGFVPKRVEDFGDGGAFPEIHLAQFPLEMGKKHDKHNNSVLPTTVDAQGNVRYDAVVKQGENSSKIVYTQHRDLVPKLPSEVPSAKPGEDEIKETTERTKMALEKIVHERLAAAQPKNVPSASSGPSYIKYTPSQLSSAFNSGAKERTIKMVEMPVDPLEPPKFKHKRVPKPSGSPPVPVMHSPPRPVTVKDQQDWKIPPCISNWKNPKGYTIPLDKRLAADGRGLQEVQINDNFAKLSEALYVAEQKAREAVTMRSKIQREITLKEKEKKEQELRALAQKSRMERAGVVAPDRGGGRAVAVEEEREEREEREEDREDREERAERQKREAIRMDRKRERERERRLEAKDAAGGKKSKLTRDRDRDITEKVALGMANVKSSGGEQVLYDQRLFNQEQGMDSGFAADDTYSVYTTGLFTSHPSIGGLHRPKKDADSEMYGGEEDLEKLKTDRFRPDKGFAGATEQRAPREKPVEFEKDEKDQDPFGLNSYLSEVKRGKKPSDRSGGGTMKASGGSGTRESYEGGSSRSRVDFQRGK
ncbi:hypothetical protein SELMODRAFT_447254 [Selaginella moellendorffii]|uniref:SKI-interacting protein SKIP SNW domain-containing protein n=1 Tax=Selaginella moellendorffii TaxID=88036 RepID=D8SY01_SELML|nr:SNW/SKI-interacting protein A [Selaginella moellendorffii]EFJ10710.1 hypothetical protein SELMODRAFT_447254 [Selaginella moellendorffii]|eukprot:XP_002988291.1 SNW/SKI-interacting protein A [Selaginella moellendorffii]